VGEGYAAKLELEPERWATHYRSIGDGAWEIFWDLIDAKITYRCHSHVSIRGEWSMILRFDGKIIYTWRFFWEGLGGDLFQQLDLIYGYV